MIHPDSNHTSEQCKKLRELKHPSTPNPAPKGKGKGKSGGKGKRIPQRPQETRSAKAMVVPKENQKENANLLEKHVHTVTKKDTLPVTVTNANAR